MVYSGFSFHRPTQGLFKGLKTTNTHDLASIIYSKLFSSFCPCLEVQNDLFVNVNTKTKGHDALLI